jgi:hypothetical protein
MHKRQLFCDSAFYRWFCQKVYYSEEWHFESMQSEVRMQQYPKKNTKKDNVKAPLFSELIITMVHST